MQNALLPVYSTLVSVTDRTDFWLSVSIHTAFAGKQTESCFAASPYCFKKFGAVTDDDVCLTVLDTDVSVERTEGFVERIPPGYFSVLRRFIASKKEFPYFCRKYTEIHLLNIPPWGIMLINNVKKIT